MRALNYGPLRSPNHPLAPHAARSAPAPHPCAAARHYKGHIFKGFPQLFPTANAEAVLFGLLKSPVALDVVQARGDQVRHAIRCKVINYPEDVRAVWVMVAVKYKAQPRQ